MLLMSSDFSLKQGVPSSAERAQRNLKAAAGGPKVSKSFCQGRINEGVKGSKISRKSSDEVGRRRRRRRRAGRAATICHGSSSLRLH